MRNKILLHGKLRLAESIWRRNAYLLSRKCPKHFNRFSAREYGLYGAGLACHGALGDGVQTEVVGEDSPRLVRNFEHINVSAVSCGWGHSAVVTEEGELYVFGRTHDMRNTIKMTRLWTNFPFLAKAAISVGASMSVDEPLPRLVPVVDERGKAVQVKDVTCSAGTTAVISDAGEVFMFGNNRFGQCGIGNRDAFVWEPTCLSGIEDIIVDVALGFQHGLALTNKGEVFAWGKGERGQLGNSMSVEDKDKIRESPVKLSQTFFNDEKLRKISCGFNSSIALTDSGKVFVWGKFQGLDLSSEHQGIYEDAFHPRIVDFPEDAEISDIYAGNFFFLAKDKKFDCLWMWGMAPGDISLEALRDKIGVQDSNVSNSSVIKLHSTGADRTFHMPFKVPVKVKDSDKIFSGFDRFFLVKKGGEVSSVDWNLDESFLSINKNYPTLVEMGVGWKHILYLCN